MDIIKNKDYENLLSQISATYTHARKQVAVTLNQHLVQTYWTIGQYIVEFEQVGEERAVYGTGLLKRLSKDLNLQYNRGFSLSNLKRMRQFYLTYPKGAKASHLLSWSHYVELLKIENQLERSFYEQQIILEKWSIPELKRQKKAALFLRLAANKNKEEILALAKQGQIIEQPSDIIRSPYVLDFLQIPEPHHLNERDLEQRIIDSLQQFLLELGKGFAFIGRQYRIMLGNRPHYVDLVFYHRILRCFVLIDLKIDEAGYEDIGQMNMYMGYFEHEENVEGDNPPIGIILARSKDELLVKYALHNVSSQLFVSKYQLYLPKKEELRALLAKQLDG